MLGVSDVDLLIHRPGSFWRLSVLIPSLINLTIILSYLEDQNLYNSQYTHIYIMYIYILLIYVCLGPLRYLNICSPFRVRSFWTPSGWGNGCVTTTTNWVLASGKRESGWEAHPLSSWNMRKNVGNRQQLEVFIGNSSINRGRGYTVYTWIVEISKFIKMTF